MRNDIIIKIVIGFFLIGVVLEIFRFWHKKVRDYKIRYRLKDETKKHNRFIKALKRVEYKINGR